MAVLGYESQLAQINLKIQEIRRRLGARAGSGVTSDMAAAVRKRNHMSAAGRKAIAAAQRKRWAAHRAKSGKGAKKAPSKPKRTLSPEAKAKLVANLAKARAARAAKAATA
jgi:hypothetical protein